MKKFDVPHTSSVAHELLNLDFCTLYILLACLHKHCGNSSICCISYCTLIFTIYPFYSIYFAHNTDTTCVATSSQCAAPPVMVAEEIVTISDGEKPQDVVLESGLRLHIPEGALSPNMSERTLTVRSFLPENGGPFLFPPNTEPVSAVYEITTPNQLSKAVSLKVEHCLEPTELASAQFTLAESPSCSPYKFAFATAKHAIYDTHGEIAICQSSLLAIIGPRQCAIRYRVQLYHQRESLTTHFIHFVLIRNLKTTVQVTFRKLIFRIA